MGSSTQKTNSSQQTTQQPWSPAIPGLQQVLGDATSLYNSGTGSGIYSGQRVAQLGDDSLSGLQSIRDQASSDNSGALGTSYLQNLLGSGGISSTTSQGLGMLPSLSGITLPSGVSPSSVLGMSGMDGNGLTAGQTSGLSALSNVPGVSGQLGLDGNGLSAGTAGALSNLSGVQGVDTSKLSSLADSLGSASNPVNQTAGAFMSGSRDLTTQPALQSLYDRALAPSSAEQNLSGVAAGANLDPTANPIFQKLAQTSSTNAANAAKEAMAASGRYGSGAFQGAVAKAVNDTDSQLYASQYNTERAAQAAAAGQIDSARQAGTQLGSGIQSQIGQVQQTNNSQRLAGAGLAQSQTAQQAGVLGQVLSGGEFNSNLDLSKANAALGAYEQGTQNNINTKEFDSNLGLSKATSALSTLNQGASNRLSAANADASNGLAAQEFNNGQSLSAQQYNSGLGLNQAQGYIGAGQSGVSSAISGASQLPSLDASRYTPAQQMLGVGSVLQGQDQSNIDAAMQYYQQMQQEPWSYLSQYGGLVGGIAGLGSEGTSVGQSTTTQQQSLGSTLVGGLSSGLGLLGMTGAFGPIGGLAGAAGGASSAGGYLTPYLKSAASSIFGK